MRPSLSTAAQVAAAFANLSPNHRDLLLDQERDLDDESGARDGAAG
ncbi:hypothetical protein [Microbacterium sulfonylureivorans]|nr:hypothetical protein [Microbacterium sulfonylureivorans]